MTTQDALLYLSSLAARDPTGEGGDPDLLSEVLDAISKVVIELDDIGAHDPDFRDLPHALAFLSTADRVAIRDKAARLMPAIWEAWA